MDLSEDIRKSVELFHLLFTRMLGEKVDQSLFALKGGCNLRFYFKSIRYSEDIDFDVHTVAKGTLQKNVNQILKSKSFEAILLARGISLSEVSDPKQTDTTQRWKLKITSSAFPEMSVPTKIEFSRRDETSNEAVLEAVDADVIRLHSLYPILCPHYALGAATLQKVRALALRKEVQARDVFDLGLLIDAGANLKSLGSKLKPQEVELAIEQAMSISYDDFRSQVVSYLKSEYQKDFGTKLYWNALQARIVEALS